MTERPALQGSINHVSITVSRLEPALEMLRPLLRFLGYTDAESIAASSGSRVAVHINPANGIAFNVWEAKREWADHAFHVYQPGLHHVAFNVATREDVDRAHTLAQELGCEILDGPDEFLFAPGGYYAFYFTGPDGIKLEIVHMPELQPMYAARD